MVTLSGTSAQNIRAVVPLRIEGTSSESINSFAQQLASAIEGVLGRSQSGSRFEIDFSPSPQLGMEPGPALDSTAGPRGNQQGQTFIVTVREALGGFHPPVQPSSVKHPGTAKSGTPGDTVGPALKASPVTASTPAVNAGAVGIQARGGNLPAPSAAQAVSGSMGMFSNAIVITGELPSTPIEPPKPKPRTPDFYVAPQPEFVWIPEGTGIMTLDSFMQQQLELVGRDGAIRAMLQGDQGWDLPTLLESFEIQAKQLAVEIGIPDPKLSPSNWQEVVGGYRGRFLQWLSQTDAAYFDPNLSGPIYDPETGMAQTVSGPVKITETPT